MAASQTGRRNSSLLWIPEQGHSTFYGSTRTPGWLFAALRVQRTGTGWWKAHYKIENNATFTRGKVTFGGAEHQWAQQNSIGDIPDLVEAKTILELSGNQAGPGLISCQP